MTTAPVTSDSELDETAIITRDLIRMNTTNYGGGRSEGETEAAEYVAQYLRDLGLEPELIDAAPGRTSVVARVPGRNSAKPALVVHGHLDVVPADPANWSVDPFSGEIRDGFIWGRGAVDMKNMNAMILTALKDTLASGGPERDLVVAFFSDEENGGIFGSHYLVDNRPDLFEGATEAISEVGGYSITVGGSRAYLLQTGEKAMIWARLTATGDAAHGSRVIPNNAVTKLARAVAKVGSLSFPVKLTDTTEALIAELAALLGVDPQRVGPEEIALATGPAGSFIQASLQTTANPTQLNAGYKHNVIPDSAVALLDIRCFPGEEESVMAQIRDLVGDDAVLDVVHQDVGMENAVSGDLMDAVTRTLRAADPGVPVLPYLLAAGTDNKALSKLGIAGYGFAPLKLPAEFDFPSMFHGVDERVPLDALVFGRAVLTDLLRTY